MKQYLLAVHMVEGEAPPESIEQTYQDVDVLNEEIKAAGAWVFAGGLHPPTTATVVRMQGDEVLTTDGPFAETKEQLGGFWIIELLTWTPRWAGRPRRPGLPGPGRGSPVPGRIAVVDVLARQRD